MYGSRSRFAAFSSSCTARSMMSTRIWRLCPASFLAPIEPAHSTSECFDGLAVNAGRAGRGIATSMQARQFT